MTVLELVNATRTYDDGVPVYALKATKLYVCDGEYVAISGPSGSGKSTLLNILGLLDVPTDGDYLIGGVSTRRLDSLVRAAIRGQIFGFVFQAYHLLPGRSALENVEIGMLYSATPPRERRRRAAEALERMGVSHRADADVRRLSGGERQRVAVARSVAYQPSVLLCDEPTGNLDRENSNQIMNLLGQLNRDGLTVVVVTHDPALADRAQRRLHVVDGDVRDV